MKSGVLSKKTKDTGCFDWNHRGLIYLFEVSSMCLVTAYISIPQIHWDNSVLRPQQGNLIGGRMGLSDSPVSCARPVAVHLDPA